MKKLLVILAIGAFAACNNSGESTETIVVDSLKTPAEATLDSLKTEAGAAVDSLKEAAGAAVDSVKEAVKQ